MNTGNLVLSRRHIFLGMLSVMASPSLGCRDKKARTGSPQMQSFDEQIQEIERGLGGHIGVASLDTRTGTSVAFRGNELFPMCSTFKMSLVAAVLARVDAGQEDLARAVRFGPEALLEHAPTCRLHVGDGAMTIEALCQAAVVVSDNTAANLLLESIGGPAGLTQYFRSLGDHTSRLDRNEESLASAIPGDPRDTTSPSAMLLTARRILVEDVLQPVSRDRLIGWMEACSTGRARVRAGLPSSWRVGDKTGGGENGAMADIVITWPRSNHPVLIVVYATGSPATPSVREAAFVRVARVVVQQLALS